MFTITQASKSLGISRQRVHVLIEAGRINAQLVGSTWIIVDMRIKPGKPVGRPAKPKIAQDIKA